MLLLTHIAPPIVVRIFGAAEVKSVYFVFFFLAKTRSGAR